MALDPLITTADLDTYGYAIPDTVDDVAMIARASARLRRCVRQDITAGTTTGLQLPGRGPWLLPQRPATSIATVEDADGNTIATTDWLLSASVLRVEPWVVWSCDPLKQYVTVTSYDHGFDTLPDGLIELACQVASRLGNAPASLTAGVTQEQGGNESVMWGSDAWAGVSGLTSGEEAAIREFYPRLPSTVQLL